MRKIRAIFFDLDGTLAPLDEEKFVEKIEKELKNTNYDEKVFELYKKSFLASMVRCIDNPSFIARKIFKDIIRYDEFTHYAHDTFKSLNFEEFKKTIKNYQILYLEYVL